MENNESNDTNGGKRLSWPIIAGFIAVIVLILVGLFLPPISLGTRLSRGGQEVAGATPEPTADVAVPLPDGVNLSVGNEATVSVVNVPATELASAAAALPVSVFPVGSAYVLSYEGDVPAGQIAIPLPPDAAPLQTLDIYGWDGQTWDHVPGQFDDAGSQAVLAEGPLPRAVILARTAAPERPAIGVEVSPEETVSAGVAPLTTEISVGTLMLGENGSLSGELAEKPEGNADLFLRVSNRAAVVDQANLSALLNNPAIQDAQINSLVGQAETEGYTGVHLDYQGVPVAQEAAFTEFVAKLSDALAARGLSFAISLGTPTAAINTWDTGGQNWAALGRLADIVYIDMPLDPAAYGPDGLATQLLDWATGQISRTKINAVHTAGTINKVGDVYTELPVSQALANLGQLRLVSEAAEVEPGGAIEVELDGTAEPLEWDGSSLAYKYTFEQAGQPQTVWFIGESALNNRLLVARDYNLRGVTVRGMGDLGSGETYAAMFNHFVGDGEPPQPGGAAIAWTVRDESDSVVASDTGSELSFDWTTADNPGTYVVEASLVLGDTVSPLGEVEVVVAGAEVVEAEATEEATPAETEGTPSPTQPAATPVAAGNVGEPGEAVAVVNVPANVRTGPGISYGTIAGGAAAGARVQLIGRNDRGDWFNIVLPSGERGWILNSLVTVNTGFNPNSLEVVEAPPPEAPAAGAPAPAPSVSGGAPPVAPVGNVGNFELGGQAAGLPVGIMQYAGMTWIKKQHKWGPGDSPQAVAGLINEAHASGMKILLSIPGQLYPSSINFEEYTNFLGGVAALGPDAIEVWNEMNIDREWPAGQIDPAAYVNSMLRPAYQKIKAANPNVMVITGAPAPTGFFGGCHGGGCDDAPYVAGMMAAGAGSVSDCVGVHYNEGLVPPAATSGDPRGAGGHYTRYFQGMINAYTAAGAGRLCFTELGYLSGEEWGYLPSGFLWKAPYNLTVAEHARYLAEAVQVAVQSGRVPMLIVFNVDFTTWGDDPQAGYAMIRPGGGCPACETLRAVMGR
jgi:hypothetical protein